MTKGKTNPFRSKESDIEGCAQGRDQRDFQWEISTGKHGYGAENEPVGSTIGDLRELYGNFIKFEDTITNLESTDNGIKITLANKKCFYIQEDSFLEDAKAGEIRISNGSTVYFWD